MSRQRAYSFLDDNLPRLTSDARAPTLARSLRTEANRATTCIALSRLALQTEDPLLDAFEVPVAKRASLGHPITTLRRLLRELEPKQRSLRIARDEAFLIRAESGRHVQQLLCRVRSSEIEPGSGFCGVVTHAPGATTLKDAAHVDRAASCGRRGGAGDRAKYGPTADRGRARSEGHAVRCLRAVSARQTDHESQKSPRSLLQKACCR